MPLPDTLQTMLAAPRESIIEPLGAFLAAYIHPTDEAPGRVRRGLEEVLRSTSDAEWRAYIDYLAALGLDWGQQDAHPVGRAMTQALMEPLLAPDSRIEGVEHLEAALGRGRRVLIVGNHLSYVDPTAAWALMHRQGQGHLADRVTAVAGPKVYEGEPMRLMGASANHAIKVAQSSQVSAEGGLGPREIVAIARSSMKLAGELMDDGRVVLIYPEGTRSRTGALGPFLKAVGRWLTLDGVLLVPFGLQGTDRIYTLDDDRLRPTTVIGAYGPALDPSDFGRRDEVVAAARTAVQALLPEEMRGA
ncbi:MAG: 1-acyl-sn-glycerol-3-phosphate acyltransferase [Deltaproteobacteria bacterium]|nr:1-acyl-sn-glycerol-3-phosphate acyltransferase [Deltaproteobacteria bacterium]